MGRCLVLCVNLPQIKKREMDYNRVGPIIVLGISSMVSSVGCYIAGPASHAAMSRVEEGHGKFLGISGGARFSVDLRLFAYADDEPRHLGGNLFSISGLFKEIFAGMAFFFFGLSRKSRRNRHPSFRQAASDFR